MDVNSCVGSRGERKFLGIVELVYPELPEGGLADLSVGRIISILDPTTLLPIFPSPTPPIMLDSVADSLVSNNFSTGSCQPQMLASAADPPVTINFSTESYQPQMLASVADPTITNNSSSESCLPHMLASVADPSVTNNFTNESCEASSSSSSSSTDDDCDEDGSNDDHERSCNLVDQKENVAILMKNGQVNHKLPTPSVGKCYETMLQLKEEEECQEKEERGKKQRQLEKERELLEKERKNLQKQQNQQPAKEQKDKKTRPKRGGDVEEIAKIEEKHKALINSKVPRIKKIEKVEIPGPSTQSQHQAFSQSNSNGIKLAPCKNIVSGINSNDQPVRKGLQLKQKNKSQKVESKENLSSVIDWADVNDSGVSLAATECDPSSRSTTPQI
ncbi:hypothetical protein QAD02_019409 [Eretmocerus hayati]|uniref:Uncharacterized protein n=1 Tax=Eretmocerus hayati TaxID=131215 RepID=A0ACC2PJT5_9HYME|nr:hypothetical protein QAD02_019409 [Eretmocerus hayati]